MPKRKQIPSMEPPQETGKYFLKSLKKCFLDPTIHNTKFIVGVEKEEFKCNGTVLAVISSVFRDLLFNQKSQRQAYADNKCPLIGLPNITPAAFSALARFAFSQDPEISPENVVEVIYASAQFRVHALYKLAVTYLNFILESYSAEYLVIYLEQATRFGLRFVVSLCMKCLCPEGAKFFLESKQFTEFPAEFLSLLLSCDELPVEEEDIWDCVLRWGKVQAKARRKNLVEMLKLVYHDVRFPLMTTAYFSSEVVPTGVLTQQETLNLFCYLTYPEGKPEVVSFSTNPRLLWEDVAVKRYKHFSEGDMIHEKGNIDCIGLKVDHRCQLGAVGTLVGKGITKCRVSVYDAGGKKRKLIETTDTQEIWRDEKSVEPAKISLKSSITLLPARTYEIQVDQTGPPSHKVKDCITLVKEKHNDLSISFSWLKASVKSFTTPKKGNIPCIWVQVFSGKRKVM